MSTLNVTGGWSPRSRCGAKSVEPIISINAKYGRLYFSAFAVRRLHLYSASVKVEQRNNEWILIVDRKNSHWKLTQYQGAFYLVHRSMVDDIMSHFNSEQVAFLIMETEEKNSVYTLTPLLNRPTRKRRNNTITTNNARRKAEIISAAKVLTNYESLDFNGRIKTQEVSKAESILRNTRR